jgi:hypothetical protein
MNRLFRFLVPALSLGAALTLAQAASQAPAGSPVTVTFVEPENYRDFSMSYAQRDYRQDYLMAELIAHIRNQARSLLLPGQRLELRILDVDLAGDFEPGRGYAGADEIRFLKEIYPPSMELEFRLLSPDGNVISEGRREIRELGYLMVTRLPASDSLRFDKALLTDWMRREFRRAGR